VALLLLLLLLAGGLLLLLSHPTKERDSGKKRPAAAAVPQGLPPAKGRAQLVVLRIEAEDELPFVSMSRNLPALADGISLVEEDGATYLLLTEEVAQAIETGKGDASLESDVKSLAEVRFVVLQKVHFTGRGRNGISRRVQFATNLPPAPSSAVPQRLELGLSENASPADSVLPLPKDLEWSIQQGALLVGGQRLAPGAQADLPLVKIKIPVRETLHKPIPQGSEPEDPFATAQKDYGPIAFRTRAHVRFWGEVTLRVTGKDR